MSVESQGYVDKKGGRTLYGRSRAYIRVNGRDYSLHRRGFNVVVFDGRTGKGFKSFKAPCTEFISFEWTLRLTVYSLQ